MKRRKSNNSVAAGCFSSFLSFNVTNSEFPRRLSSSSELISWRWCLQTYLLEEEDDSLDHLRPLLLQAEEGARRADEDLGLAVGDVVVEAAALHEPLHRVFVWRQVVVRPRELGDHLVPAGGTKWSFQFVKLIGKDHYHLHWPKKNKLVAS